MKNNKKGFTLVELLAVIAVLAILMLIAVPNIMSTINNQKRNNFLLDARRMVSKAEYLLSLDRDNREKLLNGNIGSIEYSFSDLNVKEEFLNDVDGGSYVSDTFIKVTYSNNKFNYCVYIIGSKRKITNGTDCLDSASLTSIDVVDDI